MEVIFCRRYDGVYKNNMLLVEGGCNLHGVGDSWFNAILFLGDSVRQSLAPSRTIFM